MLILDPLPEVLIYRSVVGQESAGSPSCLGYANVGGPRTLSRGTGLILTSFY